MNQTFDTLREKGSLQEPLDLCEKIREAENRDKVPANSRDAR